MEISISKLFNKFPWTEVTSGTGAVAFTANPQNGQSAGDLVRCTGDAVSQATVHHDLALSPGETITVDVLARNIPGAGIEGSYYLEFPVGSRVAECYVQGDSFQDQLPLVWTAPYNEDFATIKGRIVFGSASTRDSICEFYRPRVKVEGGILAGKRTHMYGTIEITAGTYTLMSADNFNVDTVERNSSTGEVSIRPHLELNMAYTGLVFITPVRATNTKKYYIEGRLLATSNKLEIGFYDMSTSAAVDVNSLNGTQRVNFMVLF